MATIQAKTLAESLNQALNMGLVEESFSLFGHNLTVRNLRPGEAEQVVRSCQGLEDLAFLNAYQREHVSRGIVELNGCNLRDIDFVDDEEPDPKKPGSTRKVRTEKHKWLADNLISTWAPEAVLVAYMKIGDCTTKADKQSKEGVVFNEKDTTPEEAFRKHLGDLKELEEEMPAALLDKTLDEFGYMRKSTAEELKAAQVSLDKLRREQEEQEERAQAAREAASPPPPVTPDPPPVVTPEVPAEVLLQRRPLNRVEAAPPPERTSPPPPVATPQPMGRAAQLAALEAEADTGGLLQAAPLAAPVVAHRLPGQEEVAMLGDQPKLDREAAAKAARTVIDPPPPVGINPRFRPPVR